MYTFNQYAEAIGTHPKYGFKEPEGDTRTAICYSPAAVIGKFNFINETFEITPGHEQEVEDLVTAKFGGA